MTPPIDSIVYWTVWLIIWFLPAEFIGAFYLNKKYGKGHTFSEYIEWIFDKWYEKVALTVFMFYLTVHLTLHWTGMGVLIFGIPLAVIIGKALIMDQFSWSRAIWKGIRPAVLAAAGTFAFVLVQGLPPDIFTHVGLPVALSVGLVEFLRNLVKNIHRG